MWHARAVTEDEFKQAMLELNYSEKMTETR